MVVTGALATAELASARGDPGAVLAALAPVRNIPPPRQGIDEPGFWPWPHLYADALISDGRLAEAADFLPAHEQLAAQRGRRSSIARLARARGRLEAARGRPDEADDLVRAQPRPARRTRPALRASAHSNWPMGRCCAGAASDGPR